MGVISCKRKSVIPCLKTYEIQEFSKQTLFEDDKIENLYTHFYTISNLSVEDGVIDYAEFCARLNLPTTSQISERVFSMIDANNDGVLNFREFLIGVSTFVSDIESFYESSSKIMLAASKVSEQIDMAFRLFDCKNTGKVYKIDLEALLRRTLDDTMKNSLTDEQIGILVSRTFADIDGVSFDEEGEYLDKEGFTYMMRKNPEYMKWLTVDLQRVSEGAKRINHTLKKKTVGCFGQSVIKRNFLKNGQAPNSTAPSLLIKPVSQSLPPYHNLYTLTLSPYSLPFYSQIYSNLSLVVIKDSEILEQYRPEEFQALCQCGEYLHYLQEISLYMRDDLEEMYQKRQSRMGQLSVTQRVRVKKPVVKLRKPDTELSDIVRRLFRRRRRQ